MKDQVNSWQCDLVDCRVVVFTALIRFEEAIRLERFQDESVQLKAVWSTNFSYSNENGNVIGK